MGMSAEVQRFGAHATSWSKHAWLPAVILLARRRCPFMASAGKRSIYTCSLIVIVDSASITALAAWGALRTILSQRYPWDSRPGFHGPVACPPLSLFYLNLLK